LINNPAMLQRNAVAAIARMPVLLWVFSIESTRSIAGGFSPFHLIATQLMRTTMLRRVEPQGFNEERQQLFAASPETIY